eukprot:4616873-Lingulodinium_polyedra.AAC.1
MDPASVQSQLKDFARGHRVLSREEQRQAMILAEGVADFLEAKCMEVVQGSERPSHGGGAKCMEVVQR